MKPSDSQTQDNVEDLIESIDLSSARRLWADLQDEDRPEGLEIERIGRYEVVDRIGAGGGGEVFRAVDHGPGEHSVAVKWLRRPISDERARQRAWREMDVVSDLNLPFVPRLRDYGIHEGRPFFAFDFIDGRAVDAYCDAEELTLRQRVVLLREIALAAHELHQNGLIHRDLKPSNILITNAGAPRIIDFGIAAAAETGSTGELTIEGVPMGSPSYMAPEQARGERATVLSDVYALGATASRVLAGEPLHQFDEHLSAMVAVARVGSEPGRPPREIDRNLPAPLAAVISRAASFESVDRYDSALELAEDLERWLQGDPVRAQPPRLWRTTLSWMRHNRVAAIAIFLAVVGFSATASVGSYAVGKVRGYDEVHATIVHEIEVIKEDIADGTSHIAEGWDSLRGLERLTMEIRDYWPDLPDVIGDNRVRIVRHALHEVYNVERYGGEEQLNRIEEILLEMEDNNKNH